MTKTPKPKDSSEWRDTYYHKLFGPKAAKEAERALPLFENECPNDNRPRLAIEAIKDWAEDKRELGMKEVRKLSFDSHAAAREAKTDAATFAARAAGHAVATWHVPTHALGAPMYAQKAICANKKQSSKK
ncbi:MAG: putative immunity protein [bacterium]